MPSPNEATRRRIALLRWSFSMWCIAAALLLLAWQHPAAHTDAGKIFVETLTAALGSCALAALCFDRMTSGPAAHGGVSAVLSTLLTFGFLLIGFAALHANYSRLALLLSASFWSLALYVGFRRCVKRHVMHLLVLQAHALALLRTAHPSRGAQRTGPSIRLESDVGQRPLSRWDGVVIDRHSPRDEALQRRLTQLKLANVRIYSSDHIYELLTGRVSLAHVEDNFLDDQSALLWYGAFKRLVDIIGALSLLLFCLPLMLLVAAAIRLESPGSPWFTQARLGRGGQVFRMHKFRSMHHEASGTNSLCDAMNNTGSQALPASDTPSLTTATADPRITRLGGWLRRYRIDELPQLLNVLTGDMSLIGPRPEWTESAQQFLHTIPHYPYRHLVRPGITGWAQVRQGHVTGIADSAIKLEYDLYYVKHLSLALDALIVTETLRILGSGFGAR